MSWIGLFRTFTRRSPRTKTHLFDDGFEFGNPILKAGGFVISVRVRFIDLIHAESRLLIAESISGVTGALEKALLTKPSWVQRPQGRFLSHCRAERLSNGARAGFEGEGIGTIRLEVWQFMQDWVVRLRRRFLWSPFSVVVELESGRGRFEPVAVAGVVDITGAAGRMENDQEVNLPEYL